MTLDVLFIRRSGYQRAHAEIRPIEVDEGIHDELARSVVGDLAAAVGADHRDVPGSEHMFGFAGLAEGEHRVVLDQPEFVVADVAARLFHHQTRS